MWKSINGGVHGFGEVNGEGKDERGLKALAVLPDIGREIVAGYDAGFRDLGPDIH